MSFLEKAKNALAPDPRLPEDQQIDVYVNDRIVRAEARLNPLLAGINERYEFWRGNHYAFVDSKGKLSFLPTKTNPDGSGKRPWLARSANNLLMDIVQHEVSASTQRVPSYEVTPTSPDPEKRSAARTAEQVALYGYDKWAVRNATVKAVTHAIVGQEGFAFPYFDTSVGPMIQGRNGEVVGMGEVKIRVYGPQDVMWEPGVRFEDSPYHIVVQNRTMQDVVNEAQYFGGIIIPDAETMRVGWRGVSKAANTQLVRVYYYMEKPSKSYPTGRWLVIANNRLIAKERDYPVPEGDALYALSYITDPDNDRDMGLVQHLLDPLRVYDDAWNKIVEWKNMALNPQLFVAPGVLQGQRITTEPGAVYEIADPQNNIRWREVPTLPQELFQIAQDSANLIARLAAQNDIPSQVEAGRAIQALIEKDQNRRQAFIAQLAEWYAQVASGSLRLVQEYYTEPRLLQIKGRWSAETIKDFKGANLKGQVDIRVSPGSIEPRTKAAMEQKVLAYADRGWVTPEQAMAAIEGGYGGDLVTSFELDIGRATRIIARIKTGPEAVFAGGSRMETDPTTGAPTPVPDFMPRAFDNIPVQKSLWEDWMKTEEYETLTPDMQAVADEVYNGFLHLEAQKDAQAQQALEAQATQAGMKNAVSGGNGGAAQPDQTSVTPGGSDLPTPNQPPDQNVPTP